jgi:flagellar biosynthesis chaperone FliJ
MVGQTKWNSMVENIENMYDKLKHLSIVQTDLVSKLIPNKMKNITTLIEPGEEHSFISKLETVRHNSQIVSQWINNSKMFKDEGSQDVSS